MSENVAPVDQQIKSIIEKHQYDIRSLEDAVRIIQAGPLTDHLMAWASIRRAFIAELMKEVADLVGTDIDGTDDEYRPFGITGQIEPDNMEEILLNAAVSCEGSAIDAYDAAMVEGLPQSISKLLKDHRDILRANIEEISSLEDLL